MGDREPCPHRIVGDVGGAFLFGLAGGGVWHFFKGIKNAPKGKVNSLIGGIKGVAGRASPLGGNFAAWGGIFAVCDCTLVGIRHKEDPWNSIMSGAATGGILALRAGYKTASKNALVGGVLLAMIEGLGIMVSTLVGGMQGPAIEGAPGMDGSAAPKPIGLAPPLPPIGSTASYRPTGQDIDTSATPSADVITGSGFDTSSRFEDTLATQDPFAIGSDDPFLTQPESVGGVSDRVSEKKGWFSRLTGRGGA